MRMLAQERGQPTNEAIEKGRGSCSKWTTQQLAAIVESSEDAIISRTLDGTILSWNPAAQRLYGWTAAEALGQSIAMLAPPDTANELPAILRRLLQGERVEPYDTVRLRKDGTRVDVCLTVSPIRDSSGSVVAASVIARDISQHKRAERALWESEQRYRVLARRLQLLLESTDQAVYGIDTTGACTFINRAAAEMLGWAPEQVVGQDMHDLLHHSRKDGRPYPREECPIYRAFRAGQGVRREDEVFWRADGSLFPVEYSSYPVSEGGVVSGAVVTFSDITRRKRAEEELRHSEERFRLLTEVMPQLVWSTLPDGRVDYCNPRWLDYTGLTQAEVQDDGWTRALHPDDLAPTIARWRLATQSGQEFQVEQRLQDRAGQYRWFLTRALPLRDPDGRIVKWYGTCTCIDDQKQAEDALRRQSCILKSVLDSMGDGVVVADRDGHITLFNPAAEQIHGVPAAEIGTLDWSKRYCLYQSDKVTPFPPEELTLARAIRGESVDQEELFVRHPNRPDGVWISVTGRPLKDESGAHDGGVIVIRDITQQKLAEEALSRDALLLANVRDAVVVTDVVGVVRYWNEGATRLFGWTAPEMLGTNLGEKVPERERSEGEALLQSLREGQEVAGERLDHRKDGSQVWVEGRISPLREGEGRVVGFLGVIHDIGDRKRVEAERDRLLARLQLQIERMPLAYILFDPDFRITDWNPAAEQIFGYTRAEALGMQPNDLNPPSFHREATRIIERIRSGDMGAHSVNENLTRNGRTITCEWFNTPLMADDGRFDGLLCLGRDITEHKSLEAQYRQAQKMEAIGQLAGGVAHDFNNLLTIINGYSELLLQTLRPEDSMRGLVNEIQKAGERSASLTRQLLAFSRKQMVTPKLLDLNAVVADTEKMLRRLIGEDVRLATTLAAELGMVRADPGQIEQVLLNLAVNAQDAMPQGGTLTIETRNVELDAGDTRLHPPVRPGRYVLLSMRDTGCGMAPEVKARIFEPFFTTKGVGKGTGLGLAVVHGVIHQGGGHIAVETAPGAGTTFQIYLPRSDGLADAANSHAGIKPAARGTETILVVEDEDGVRAMTRHVLTECGYTVLQAADGEEALRIAGGHSGSIDLLATDVVMPRLGGRQLAEQLLQLHPETKVLYLSGYTDDAVVRHGVHDDQMNFLQKPFAPHLLSRKVRDILDAAQATPLSPTQ